MDLSQQSITGRGFELNRRGYDPDAVDAHLADIAAAVGARERTIAELEASISSLTARVRDADESEEALRLTLKAAAHAKEELLAGARDQAKAIEGDATAEAEALISDAKDKADASIAGAEARVAAMEEGARQQAGKVAQAALAESEALVARIEELRERLSSAEDALSLLRSESAPHVEAARNALESALDQAREGVDNPESMAVSAGESDPESPETIAEDGEQSEASVHTNEPEPEVEPYVTPEPEPATVDPEAGDTVEAAHRDAGDGEDADQPERHLEVVEAAESTADISDKVDRLLEELREVT